MKKNGQYVGVDEKYIPDEEKYVDNSVNSELKDMVNEGLKSAKDYISDKDNQEKIKKTGKKGLKILKGVGIFHLVCIGFFFLLFILAFGFIIWTFISIINKNNSFEEGLISNPGIVEKEDIENFSSFDISLFNDELELY